MEVITCYNLCYYRNLYNSTFNIFLFSFVRISVKSSENLEQLLVTINIKYTL